MALCQNVRSSEQRLEAMRWYFGKRHCRMITLADDGRDVGEYFELNTIDYNYNVKKYVVFLDDGVATEPSINSDQTLISVSVGLNDSDNDKALAMQTALINNSVEVRTEVIGANIEIQNWFVGKIDIEDTSNAPDLVFEISVVGFGGYLGQTGETDLTFNTELVQLLDDAQGTVIQEEIIVGYSAELPLPIKEMSTQRWKDLVGEVTGNILEVNGKEVIGWGTAKLYQSMFQYSGRLVGHPVRNESNNISEDIVMLNTAPKFNSTNFSGANAQETEFLFTSYRDANADTKINLLARGDHSEF